MQKVGKDTVDATSNVRRPPELQAIAAEVAGYSKVFEEGAAATEKSTAPSPSTGDRGADQLPQELCEGFFTGQARRAYAGLTGDHKPFESLAGKSRVREVLAGPLTAR
jgi:hypothetical protein